MFSVCDQPNNEKSRTAEEEEDEEEEEEEVGDNTPEELAEKAPTAHQNTQPPLTGFVCVGMLSLWHRSGSTAITSISYLSAASNDGDVVKWT